MVRKKAIGFGIISREEEQQDGSTGDTLVVRFLSHCAQQSLPPAALGEMECEMSAFNIPAVNYTLRVLLRPGSRATTCLTVAPSVVGLHLLPLKVCLPSTECHLLAVQYTLSSVVPPVKTLGYERYLFFF